MKLTWTWYLSDHVESDPEDPKKTDKDNNGSVNLDTSELEALNHDQELDLETVKKYLDRSQLDDVVSKILLDMIEQYNELQ